MKSFLVEEDSSHLPTLTAASFISFKYQTQMKEQYNIYKSHDLTNAPEDEDTAKEGKPQRQSYALSKY